MRRSNVYRPTPCDLKVLAAIAKLEPLHRWLPSLAEIGLEAGLCENTVRDCVLRLKRRGYADNLRGASRTTHLTDLGRQATQEAA